MTTGICATAKKTSKYQNTPKRQKSRQRSETTLVYNGRVVMTQRRSRQIGSNASFCDPIRNCTKLQMLVLNFDKLWLGGPLMTRNYIVKSQNWQETLKFSWLLQTDIANLVCMAVETWNCLAATKDLTTDDVWDIICFDWLFGRLWYHTILLPEAEMAVNYRDNQVTGSGWASECPNDPLKGHGQHKWTYVSCYCGRAPTISVDLTIKAPQVQQIWLQRPAGDRKILNYADQSVTAQSSWKFHDFTRKAHNWCLTTLYSSQCLNDSNAYNWNLRYCR